jgi:hypothetical protein
MKVKVKSGQYMFELRTRAGQIMAEILLSYARDDNWWKEAIIWQQGFLYSR